MGTCKTGRAAVRLGSGHTGDSSSGRPLSQQHPGVSTGAGGGTRCPAVDVWWRPADPSTPRSGKRELNSTGRWFPVHTHQISGWHIQLPDSLEREQGRRQGRAHTRRGDPRAGGWLRAGASTPAFVNKGLLDRPHPLGAQGGSFLPLMGKLCRPSALNRRRRGDVCVPSCVWTPRKFEELQLPLPPT